MSVNGSHEHRRLDWMLAVIAGAAIVGTAQGRRIALLVQDISFATAVILIVLFLGMAWWRTGVALRDHVAVRWKLWVSLAGCVALSLGFGLPCIQDWFGFRPWIGSDWNYTLLMIGYGMAAFLAGVFAAQRVGFALMCGGFLLALVGVVMPIPIL